MRLRQSKLDPFIVELKPEVEMMGENFGVSFVVFTLENIVEGLKIIQKHLQHHETFEKHSKTFNIENKINKLECFATIVFKFVASKASKHLKLNVFLLKQ
jgi:hypothetical protein